MSDQVVHPGAFCHAGDTGVFSSGTAAVCSIKAGGDRARWRRDPNSPAQPRRRGGGTGLRRAAIVRLGPEDLLPPKVAEQLSPTQIDALRQGAGLPRHGDGPQRKDMLKLLEEAGLRNPDGTTT